MKQVVVTGATGFVGTALVKALQARGDRVIVLSRDGARAKAALGEVLAVSADLEAPGPWTAHLAGVDAVVHLAGEPVAAKRWDARQKQVIRDSRVESTRMIVDTLAGLPADRRPGVLVAASGSDYYPYDEGQAGFDDDEVTEKDPPGDQFLARVCRDWEREAKAAEAHGIRVARMRTGLVLGKSASFAKMQTPFKLFVGGRIGSGKQWLSWIHLDDVVAAYLAAIDDERYTGALNLVTDSTRNAAFARAMGHALGRPSWMPVPGLALKLAVGEFADVLLHGRRVVPTKLRALGFTFKYPDLSSALTAAL